MHRIKQTARKSVGRKAPRKQVATRAALEALESTCQGLTKDGTKCTRTVTDRFCWQHMPAEPKVDVPKAQLIQTTGFSRVIGHHIVGIIENRVVYFTIEGVRYLVSIDISKHGTCWEVQATKDHTLPDYANQGYDKLSTQKLDQSLKRLRKFLHMGTIKDVVKETITTGGFGMLKASTRLEYNDRTIIVYEDGDSIKYVPLQLCLKRVLNE
jgi:hypothetical protein